MEDEKKFITLTHINTRQSIFFLLLKLVYLDAFATLLILIILSSSGLPYLTDEAKLALIDSEKVYFIAIMLGKLVLTLYVVLDWLNEYYEITPNLLTHRKGILWQKEEDYDLRHIKSLGIQQGFFGKLFNYGSISFYERELRETKLMYLVHNPMKYIKVLESLISNITEEKEVFREEVEEAGVE